MKNKKPLIVGGVGGVVVTMLAGWMFGGGDGELHEGMGALQSVQAELGERLEGLEAGREAVTTQLAGLMETQEGLTTRLDEVQAQVTEQLAETGAATIALQEKVAGLSADMEEAQSSLSSAAAAVGAGAAATAAAVASAPDTTEEPAASASASASAAPAAAASGTLLAGAGQTVTLGEGLRVFLSRADADAGTASVAVNGLGLTTLRQGQPAGVAGPDGFCHLTMNAVSAAGVDLTHVCGDDVPAPVGVGIGETQVFDGARAFLSRLDAEAGVAEVAVNGLTPVAVTYDAPLKVRTEAGRCELALANIDRGHANFEMTCPE